MSEYRENFGKISIFILYVVSAVLIFYLLWILKYAAGHIPLGNELFSGAVYELIIPGSLLLLLFFLAAAKKGKKWKEGRLCRTAIVLLGLIVVLQLLYLYVIRVYVNYDNLLILNQALYMQSSGSFDPDFYNAYFQRYSQNYLITILLYLALGVAGKLGIHSLHWVPCLTAMACVDTGLIFAFLTAKQLKGWYGAYLLALLCLLNPVIYLWLPWHYTTVCSLPFLTGTLFFALKQKRSQNCKQRVVYGILLGCILAAGICIRVTILIGLMALILCSFLWKAWKWEKKRLLQMGLSVLLTMTVTFGAYKMLENHFVTFDNSEKAFPVTHYIMMGTARNGTYSYEDVAYTMSFPGKEQKIRANLQELKNRVERLGTSGVMDLWGNKIHITWGDGTGGLQAQWMFETENSDSFLYLCGEKNDLFRLYAQLYHVMLLFLVLAGVIFRMRKKRFDLFLAAGMILAGHMMFYTVWEAQNKYNIGLVFVLALLAMDGLDDLAVLRSGCLRTVSEKKSSLQKWGVISRTDRGKCSVSFGPEGILAAVLVLYLCVSLYQPLIREEISYREFTFRNGYDVGLALENVMSGQEITQTFVADRPFNRLYIPAKYMSKDPGQGLCRVEIRNQANEAVVIEEVPASKIGEEEIAVAFDTIFPNGEEDFTVRVIPEEIALENPLRFPIFQMTLDLYPQGTLCRDGAETAGDLLMSVYYEGKETYFQHEYR